MKFPIQLIPVVFLLLTSDTVTADWEAKLFTPDPSKMVIVYKDGPVSSLNETVLYPGAD